MSPQANTSRVNSIRVEDGGPQRKRGQIDDEQQGNREHHPRRWQKEVAARDKLRHQFHSLNAAVQDLTDQVVRASSIIENINSRLRSYFFLRKQLGPDYLELLQFFLNHHRFLRSDRPERVGKSPAELLTGQTHPHWLEMLGYPLFSRN